MATRKASRERYGAETEDAAVATDQSVPLARHERHADDRLAQVPSADRTAERRVTEREHPAVTRAASR